MNFPLRLIIDPGSHLLFTSNFKTKCLEHFEFGVGTQGRHLFQVFVSMKKKRSFNNIRRMYNQVTLSYI